MSDDRAVAIRSQSLEVTPESIQETIQSIELLQGMVKGILLRDIDYGRIPGTPQDSLWDPGASRIITSFGCYCGQRRILRLEDSDQKIVVCVEVPIISRKLQVEVASGVGAASTLETKYKYRWVEDPREWGYSEEAAKAFRTKHGKDEEGGKLLYRIPNPEHSELLNTIIKMASKRAEVDAAESLPGVSSVLRLIFSGREAKKPPDIDKYTGPRWQRFWGEVTRLGYTREELHGKFKVKTMHDWLSQGRSLDEALNILRESPSAEQSNQKPPSQSKDRKPRDPKSITTINELLRACNEDFGMQPADVYKELGYTSAQDITQTPEECYIQIKGVRIT
jgi:hypothetical protein